MHRVALFYIGLLVNSLFGMEPVEIQQLIPGSHHQKGFLEELGQKLNKLKTEKELEARSHIYSQMPPEELEAFLADSSLAKDIVNRLDRPKLMELVTAQANDITQKTQLYDVEIDELQLVSPNLCQKYLFCQEHELKPVMSPTFKSRLRGILTARDEKDIAEYRTYFKKFFDFACEIDDYAQSEKSRNEKLENRILSSALLWTIPALAGYFTQNLLLGVFPLGLQLGHLGVSMAHIYKNRQRSSDSQILARQTEHWKNIMAECLNVCETAKEKKDSFVINIEPEEVSYDTL